MEIKKNHEQLQAKWRIAFQAIGTEIYISCDRCSIMRSIYIEINLSTGWQLEWYC